MNKLQGPFFGLSKRTFTEDEIKKIAEGVASAIKLAQ